MTSIFMDFDHIYDMRHEFLPAEQGSNPVKRMIVWVKKKKGIKG